MPRPAMLSFFFFNDTATTEIYTLSLHDALPILIDAGLPTADAALIEIHIDVLGLVDFGAKTLSRSEEHTSELQSHLNLVCRLLLEKKKNKNGKIPYETQNRQKSKCADKPDNRLN